MPQALQAQSTTHKWHVLVLESADERLEIAERYVENMVREKWQKKEWTIDGFNVADCEAELQTNAESTVSRPQFEVCSIKGGQLHVNQGMVDSFAGVNIGLRARLQSLVQKHNQEYFNAKWTIGAPPQERRREAADSAPALDRNAAVPPAPTTVTQLQFVDWPIPDDNILATWNIIPGLCGVLTPSGDVLLASEGDSPTSVGGATEGKFLCNFGAGSWAWLDQLPEESRAKGPANMFRAT